jgi:exo-beta-1,3-glucanase (GH17 family)
MSTFEQPPPQEQAAQDNPSVSLASAPGSSDGLCGSNKCVIFIMVILVLLVAGATVGTVLGVRAVPFQARPDHSPVDPNTDASDDTTSTAASASPALPETLDDDLSPDPDAPRDKANRFYGLSYSPFGLGDNCLCPPWQHVGSMCLLADQVKKDMRQLSSITRRVKLYSMYCMDTIPTILNYALANNMTVVLGVWVSKYEASNAEEVIRLQTILAKYASAGVISDVMIGNEAIFVERASVAQLAGVVAAVRAQVDAVFPTSTRSIQIGSADIDGVWVGRDVGSTEVEALDGVDMEPVIRAGLDWIGVNVHPYYAGYEPTEGKAAEFVKNSSDGVYAYWKAKGLARPVFVTETGFPTVTPSVVGLEAFAAAMELTSRANNLTVCKC